ncbi:hypothetical protein BELINDA_32 [Bacillus phage Belinda]|uniref:hypothetical protein n=1 Tax=Bacillus phage Belinda TaxID=1852564 RepID=UPI0007F0FC38|nr:hypothetical protein BI039_gp032 [Bacillus phage Belinda]ANM45961.1 hypothetical protein BELINDA_32 [Bacillus phage Belinda]
MIKSFDFNSDSENIFATMHLRLTDKGKFKLTIREYETEDKKGNNRKQTAVLDVAETHRLLNNLEKKLNEYTHRASTMTITREYYSSNHIEGVSTWMLEDKSLFGMATLHPLDIHNVAFFKLRKFQEVIDAVRIIAKRQEEMSRAKTLKK